MVSNQNPPPSGSQENTVHITFAAGKFDRRVYEPLINAFHQKYPNIVVQYVDFPSDLQHLDSHTLTSLADTTILPFTPPEVSRAYINLGPLVEDDPDFNRDDFWPGILTACQTVDETQTGIPLTASVTGIFYDRQAFDDAGLPYPMPGWTWDEFRQNVIALASNPNTGPKYGFTDSLNVDHSILAPLVDAHLASSMGDFDIELLANDIHWYVDFVRQAAIYAAWENNDYTLALKNWQTLYGNDARPAMWAGDLASQMPGGASPIWVKCVGISASTAHPRAAWEWVKFLSQNWVNDSSLIGGDLQAPARPSVADHFNYWGNLPPGIEPAVRFALEHAWYGSHYTEDINQISEGLSNAINGLLVC